MIKVHLYDENDTNFATLDMLELPRKDDVIEIGFEGVQAVKWFVIQAVVHKMIPLPAYETRYVEGVPVQCRNDPPWRWEFRLHGVLSDA